MFYDVHRNLRLYGVIFYKKVSDADPNPIFYQFVTDEIFRCMIKENLPIEKDDLQDDRQSLSYEETNSLRFVAGYILRALKKKITSSSLEELLLCLINLLESSDEVYDDSSGDWVKSIDRGGTMFPITCRFSYHAHVDSLIMHMSMHGNSCKKTYSYYYIYESYS